MQTGQNATTTTEQGRAYEDLVRYFFEAIPGLAVTAQDRLDVFHTQEIDVMLWNDKHAKGLYFLPHMFFVECKNWLNPVSSAEVAWFDRKLQDHGLTFGVIVAAKGITGDPDQLSSAHQIIAAALREQREIIVITRQNIEAITHSVQIVQLLKNELSRLHLLRTSL